MKFVTQFLRFEILLQNNPNKSTNKGNKENAFKLETYLEK